MGLTCVMLCAIGGIVADSVVAADDYQYWQPPSAAYRRQSYGYDDTSPNLNNMLTEPGVAAAVFFAGSGVSALCWYIEF